MNTNDRHTISDLTLERYHLGELDSAQRTTIDMLVAADETIRGRLSALASSDAEIRSGHLIQRLIPDSVGRSRSIPRWQWSALTSAAATAAVAIVAVVAWWSGVRDATTESGTFTAASTERVKGETASLMLYRKTDAGSELLADGAPVRQGDVIRVAYRTGAPCFGVIVSIDGARVVTRHLPVDAPAATAMKSGDSTPLESAYELDDAPKWERFFLVTSDRAFDVDAVLDAAHRVAATAGTEPPDALPLPSSFHQSTFLLRKVF